MLSQECKGVDVPGASFVFQGAACERKSINAMEGDCGLKQDESLFAVTF